MAQPLLSELSGILLHLQERSRFLKTFTIGGGNAIMSRARTEEMYPALWLEPPAWRPADNGAGHLTAPNEVGVAVLDQVRGDEDEAATYERCQQLVVDVLSYLYRGGQLRAYGFDLNQVRVEPISTLFFDNERGWRISFPLTTSLNLTFDPARWHEEGTVPPSNP